MVTKLLYQTELNNVVTQRRDETLYHAVVLTLYQTKVRRSGRLYQAKVPICRGAGLPNTVRTMPDQGLYTRVGAGKLELELELESNSYI